MIKERSHTVNSASVGDRKKMLIPPLKNTHQLCGV